ncbi:MAG: HEAT repeat domain-containing protein [Patescibacteria group bacterium]|nr:HEAT repeat domain-containing protein [Patescibacteria group bacterium]
MPTNNIDQKELMKESSKLFQKDASIEDKKRIIFQLAHIGTPKSFQTLEKYLENPDKKLQGWAIIAAEECLTFLQDNLDEEDEDSARVSIMTGAGGDGSRLRFYFIIGTENNKPLTKLQKENIEKNFDHISKKLDSKIEQLEFGKNYVLIKSLLSMEIVPDDLIMTSIKKCNQPTRFLCEHYYVNNVKKPSKQDIFEYLDYLKTGYDQKK